LQAGFATKFAYIDSAIPEEDFPWSGSGPTYVVRQRRVSGRFLLAFVPLTALFVQGAGGFFSLIPRQLAASPMLFFPRRVEHALDVTVQRSPCSISRCFTRNSAIFSGGIAYSD
jgi:hypothetical protein